MVDISTKQASTRTAIAIAEIDCSTDVINEIKSNNTPKGDVFATARIAGIQAAKKCADLIPLCHQLPLTNADINFAMVDNTIIITAKCKTIAKTGVEMEALTAASIAALTIYDMCKALDKSMTINQIRLLEKTGGKSGDFHAR